MIQKLKSLLQFLSGVNLEFSRVTWPTRQELIGTTMVVLILVLFFSVYLGFIDFMFAKLAARVF